MDLAFAAKFLGALFAIMNPFITLPIFLSLTEGRSVAEQRAMAVRITLYTAVMCAVVAIAGNALIGFFGVTIDSFRVAGGLVLLGIALSMLNGKPITAHERGDHEKKADDAANDDSDLPWPAEKGRNIILTSGTTGTPQRRPAPGPERLRRHGRAV